MISICIIVKNDFDNMEKCLSLLKHLGYEIVVVDTGSTDNTIAVSKKYTNLVYEFIWCNDFSAARNYAILKASNPYILMVDSDEMLVDFDKKELERLVIQNPTGIGRIHRNNPFERNGNQFIGKELVNRLFPKDLFHYEGKVHEQLVANKGGMVESYEVPLTFFHEGYNGTYEQRIAKAERNIKLLDEMLSENKQDTYILYQLGKSYYFKQCYQQAVEYFEQAFQYDLNPKLEYVIDMIEVYGYALINAKQYEKALGLENLSDDFGNTADFNFLLGLIYQENARFDQAVGHYLKATQYNDARMDGVNGYLAFYNIGVIFECLGLKDKAIQHYKKCGDYKKAMEGINRCQ